jgi:hypothetical protein
MKTFLRCAALAPLLALVAGCCANNANNCDDLQADSLFLVLKDASKSSSPTDTTYFSTAQLDTVYLQRYAPATPARPANGATPAQPAQPEGALSDPVSIVRAQQTKVNSVLLRKLNRATPRLSADSTIVISNTTPFAPSITGGKLSAYNYVLTVQDRSVKPRRTYTYKLVNIMLQGQYNADGCYTCYENSKKQFTLIGRNTRTIDVTESGSGANKAPVPVSISKLD